MVDPRHFDAPRFLARLPLFSDIEPEALQRLALGCQVRHLDRGAMLFRTGDPCEAFFVVLMGQVKLYALSPAGQEKVIEIIGPGQSFAEALMFLGKPCMVNAQALGESVLLEVQRQPLMDELERDNRLALRMLAGLSRRLHGLVSDVQNYALRNGAQRLIGYLLNGREGEEAEGSAPVDGAEAAADANRPFTVRLPVSKATVASRLSITPEYFSRLLRELEEAGLIAMDRREIRILDPRGLAAYSGG